MFLKVRINLLIVAHVRTLPVADVTVADRGYGARLIRTNHTSHNDDIWKRKDR